MSVPFEVVNSLELVYLLLCKLLVWRNPCNLKLLSVFGNSYVKCIHSVCFDRLFDTKSDTFAYRVCRIYQKVVE